MSPLHVVILVLLAALGLLGAAYGRDRRRDARALRTSPRRILFPFTGQGLSRRALDASLRLARSDGATLVPVLLARVPLNLPLDAALPRQCGAGMPLLEAVEHRAAALGVPVDARIGRGRTERHALRETIAQERFDRIVVAAAGRDAEGFHGEDIAWLLDHAPGEVVIVRPRPGDSELDLRAHEDRPLVGHAEVLDGAGRVA